VAGNLLRYGIAFDRDFERLVNGVFAAFVVEGRGDAVFVLVEINGPLSALSRPRILGDFEILRFIGHLLLHEDLMLRQLFAAYIYLALLVLEGLARQADYPLDEIGLRVLGELEDHDIAAANRALRKDR